MIDMKVYYIDIILHNGAKHHYTVKARHRKSALIKAINSLDLDNYENIQNIVFRTKEFKE